MMKVKTYQLLERITGITILLFSLLFFTFRYPHHLFFTEQMQLFLLTPAYFSAYLSKPAALASYPGDFFTPFYYLRGGGALVITSHLLILWLLLRSMIRRFSGTPTTPLTANHTFLTFVPTDRKQSYSFCPKKILNFTTTLISPSIFLNYWETVQPLMRLTWKRYFSKQKQKK